MRIKYQGNKKYVTFRELFDIHFSKRWCDADTYDYMFAITFNGREFVWYIYRGKP